MKAAYHAMPRFALNLSKQELFTLMACSNIHYDAVCRSAGKLGGFLYGWNMQAVAVENDPNTANDPNGEMDSLPVLADSSQMQTCLKILEMPPEIFRPDANKLYAQFYYCVRVADEELRNKGRAIQFPLSNMSIQEVGRALCPTLPFRATVVSTPTMQTDRPKGFVFEYAIRFTDGMYYAGADYVRNPKHGQMAYKHRVGPDKYVPQHKAMTYTENAAHRIIDDNADLFVGCTVEKII